MKVAVIVLFATIFLAFAMNLSSAEADGAMADVDGAERKMAYGCGLYEYILELYYRCFN